MEGNEVGIPPNETASTGQPAQRPAGRQYAYGLGFIAVVLAVIVGTPAWLLAAGRTCGCAQPPDLAISNLDTRPVTVTWRQPGILGTTILGRTESASVGACSGFTTTLPAGHVALEISSATAVGAFEVDVPGTFSETFIASFTVRSGGAVDRVWGRSAGDEPCGS
jgi:hypothetical protein